MAEFQVVAVYPSGRRFAVRDAHDSFSRAETHRSRCETTSDPRDEWTYEIDVSYTGADGQTHKRFGVTGDDLGYSPEEVDSYRWDCKP